MAGPPGTRCATSKLPSWSGTKEMPIPAGTVDDMGGSCGDACAESCRVCVGDRRPGDVPVWCRGTCGERAGDAGDVPSLCEPPRSGCARGGNVRGDPERGDPAGEGGLRRGPEAITCDGLGGRPTFAGSERRLGTVVGLGGEGLRDA
jgi:hypothetical protein